MSVLIEFLILSRRNTVLKDKSAAINKMAEEYEEEILEPELKPEYIEKLKKIEKQEAIEVGTVENLRKRYGL